MKPFSPKRLARELASAIEDEIGISVADWKVEEVDQGDYGTWHRYQFFFSEHINPSIAGPIAVMAWEDFFRGKYKLQARAGIWMDQFEYDSKTKTDFLVREGQFFTITSVAPRHTGAAFEQLGPMIHKMDREESGKFNALNGVQYELRVPDAWTWLEERKGPPKSGKHYSVSNIIPL